MHRKASPLRYSTLSTTPKADTLGYIETKMTTVDTEDDYLTTAT